MNDSIDNEPARALGSIQELWEHRLGVVSPAESQGGFKEVAFEPVKDEKGTSLETQRSPVTPADCGLPQHTPPLNLLVPHDTRDAPGAQPLTHRHLACRRER